MKNGMEYIRDFYGVPNHDVDLSLNVPIYPTQE